MPLSKPFAVATSGSTVDGRAISRDWITQMAATYDPKVYTALANLEHYLSMLPDSIFKAYGKVVSLTTRETEILGEKQLQLMAVVDVSQEVVDLQKKGQKLFASVEILNNFVGKGVAYLTGLAFTDQPASLGTESMKFSASGASGERFSFADEVELTFEAAEADTSSPGDTLFSKIKALLGIKDKSDQDKFADQSLAIEAMATSQKELIDGFARIEKEMAELGTQVKLTEEHIEDRKKELSALRDELSNAEQGTQRPSASGGNGTVKTDC